MRKLSIALLAVSLAGCASLPQPKPQPVQRSATVVKPAPKPIEAKPVEATTPNQIVKKRWYERFMRHKSK